MTDNKPLITYAGEIPVFQGVIPSLQKWIGAEAVEWKRAYGRSTKHVHLHPRFIPFEPPASSQSQQSASQQQSGVVNENSASSSILTSLLDQPMLHTFWTDCSDVEVYRATTKDVIQSWLNSVKSCNVKEWLIVLVEPSDNKKTNKLLPRSSVLDKIKNDFAQKQTERCVCLSDPQKLDSKSAESPMLHRIRQLLLASYSKTLIKFEENMRAQREKRNEVGWNFCHYFLLQEELAFVLEMLEVYDEALVQYDELDALFTQFVLNSHFTDTPKWLLSFQRYGDRWPALILSSSSGGNKVIPKIRETIRNSTVSLLNFRNYLFARQAILLVKQRRLNELAQRSLAFLHICINELNILDVTFTEDGSISCWVFVSCLEILGSISNQNLPTLATTNTKSDGKENVSASEDNENDNVDLNVVGGKFGKVKSSHSHLPHASTLDFSVHTASLWDYAREKLYELGKLCGLLPKSQLKSDHLHKVISLASGLSPFEEFTNSNGNGSSSETNNSHHHSTDEIQLPLPELPPGETPIEKLKNALSSKEKFQNNYLELCELAMGTYKHIGRLRSARKVGLSLASYYMEAEDFNKSIVFLTEAFNTFKEDRWNILTIDVLLKLAQCYQSVNDMDRYIRTCAQISCSKSIDGDKRNHYFDEMMNCLTKLENNDRFIMSSTEETFLIRNVKVDTSGKIHGSSCDVCVDLQLVSNLPRPILSNVVQMAIVPCDHIPKQINYYTTGTFVQGEITKGKQGKRGSGDNLNISKRKDSNESNNSSSESSVENLSGKHTLARKESVTPIFTCEDEDIALVLMEMNPAVNMVDLRQQFESGTSVGGNKLSSEAASVAKEKFVSGKLTCHNLHQSLRRKDSSQVQGETQVSKTDFSEVAKKNDIIINPGSNNIILSAKVLKAGSYRLAQVSIGVKHFELLSPRLGCRYRFTVSKEPPNICIQAGNLVAGIEQQVIITINTGSHVIDKEMVLLVRSSLGMKLKHTSESSSQTELSLHMPETQPFSVASIPLIVKADLGTQKDSTLFEHKLIAKCPWTNDEKKLSLTFVPPFIASYKLHSVGQRKFIQVLLVGNSDSSFKISEHQLTVQSPNSQNIPLVALNPRSQSLILDSGKCAAYMWEIGVIELEDEQPLRLEFSIKFKADEKEPELYKYYICLQKFKTQYELKSNVEPHKGTEFCRVGNMCSMLIEISKYGKKKENKSDDVQLQNSLMYEVRADQHMWAICGRSSGIVSLEDENNENSQQVSLDVMPMSPGYLPLPTVHLSKYIPADQKSGTSSNVPKLEPFSSGQVYNRSKGTQVHILPPPQSLGSTTGLSGGSGGSGGSSLQMIVNDSHFN